MSEALSKLALITDALRKFDLAHAELTPPDFDNGFAVGAAVRLNDEDFALVSVPVGVILNIVPFPLVPPAPLSEPADRPPACAAE